MNKYAGLMRIADPQGVQEKQALLDAYANWQERHPWLSLGSYFVPVAGAVPAGLDAARAFSQGRILSGLGNTALAATSLVGGGMLAKGIGSAIEALGRGATAASRVAPLLSHVEPAIQAAAPRVTNLTNQADRLGHRLAKPFGGVGMLGGAGAVGTIGGGLVEGGDPAFARGAEQATRTPYSGLSDQFGY